MNGSFTCYLFMLSAYRRNALSYQIASKHARAVTLDADIEVCSSVCQESS